MEPDPYRYFRLEARELLDQFAAAANALQGRGQGGPAIARALRLAHTLKGAARVVKEAEIAERAHAIEEVLAPYRDEGAAIPRERVSALLGHLDEIAARVAALAPDEAAGSAAGETAARTVRAEIAEMDALLDRVAQAQAQLNRLRGTAAAVDPAIGVGIDRVERELRQLGAAAEQLRLIPAQALFAPLQRTALDAAHALGKEVAFYGTGGGIRLDADVLAAVQPALVQIVRNAVAHGIEHGAERRAAGKPGTGRIDFGVARRGGRIVFACRDDGAGMDLDAVRRIAVRRGLVSAAATELGAADLVGLMLRGGISTAEAVTELSGRGVGLDLVRATVERLGGAVDVQTRPGAGTAFELAVPLSLAAVEALAVEADGVAAAIPLDAVRGAVRISAADIVPALGGAMVPFASETIPFLPLARALGGPARSPGSWSCAVVAGAGGIVALGVDRLLGTATAVMRPLPELVPPSAIVAGVALDADGTPRLVLNADGLVAAALRAEPHSPDPGSTPVRDPVLVVDDSLTTRMLEQGILEAAGYEVELAISAEDALQAARRRRYSLFLVDVEMPGMDGFAFVERTRADPELRGVPAVLVTSRAAPEDRRRGLAAGAAGYIDKGAFNQAELLALIGPLVGAPAP